VKNFENCLFALIFPVCLFFTTCTNPNNSTDEIEEDGITRIAITLPGATTAKTVGDPAKMEYELVFQGPGGQTITETASGGQTVTVRVKPGLWTVRVRSYDPATGVDEAKGEVLSFDVKAGQTNSPIVQMRFVQTAPIALYLASVTGGLSASDPVSLHLDLPLDSTAWSGLLSAINTAGKFVDLNLSACTGSGSGAGLRGDGTFDPDYNSLTGKDRIVSLALPDTATGIVPGNVVVDPVTQLGTATPTFNGFSNLRSLSGARITIIGYMAFYGCTDMALTELPASLTTIGIGAFWDCTSLALTELPAGLTTIGEGVFAFCTNLALKSLPASLITIERQAFLGCTNLALKSLPAGITTIGNTAFQGCTNLALKELPKNLTTINDYTFIDCTNLALTELPANLISIGDQAFQGCTSLALTELPANLISIGDQAFYGCTSLALKSLPAGIKTIGRYTFAQCKSLTTLDLSNVTVIHLSAFDHCTSLVSVTLGNGLDMIDGSPFEGAGDLYTVYISGGRVAGTYVRDDGNDMTWELKP
jgi:hypothetical protein